MKREDKVKNRKFLLLFTIYYLLSIILCGCATIYPYATPYEIREAEEELKVKALKFKIEYLVRVNEVSFNLLKSLPSEDRKGEFVFSGLLIAEIDKYLKRLYNLSEDTGVVIIGTIKGSPADSAGFLAGDIVEKVESKDIKNARDFVWILRKYKPKDSITLDVIRGGERLSLTLKLGVRPVDVYSKMHDSQEVNAGVTENLVVVTYGLIRFLKSDDELAVILGHEFAHITRGHLLKVKGTSLVSLILGVALGIGIESIFPGAGDITTEIISSAFGARFSREFEREADYFGLRYAYLAGYDIEKGSEVWERFGIEVPSTLTRDFFSTHPTSGERLVRIKKAVEEIRSKEVYRTE